MQITRGKRARAQRVIIYGPEGIGKSTFAAQFPNPVFIDTEGSTDNMDVARLDKPSSWTMLNNEIAFIKANPTACKTLVIDTIDWAEQLATSAVCAEHGKKGIEEFGYGNGYVYVKEEIGRFLNKLSELVDLGINIVLTAHAQIRTFTQPDELGAYDRYELKLGKKTGSITAPLVKEWADMVLFANYKTIVVTGDKNKKKAQGNERVMYTQHHAAWDAKNRHGLPEELPFNYGAIAHIFSGQQPAPEQPVTPEVTPQPTTLQATDVPPSQVQTELGVDMTQVAKQTASSQELHRSLPQALQDLMREAHVTEDELKQVAYIRGHFPLNTPIENFPADYWDMIVTHWQQTLEVVTNQVRAEPDLPFTLQE